MIFIKARFRTQDPFLEVKRQARQARDALVESFLLRHGAQLMAIPKQVKQAVVTSDACGVVQMLNENKVSSVMLLLIYAERVRDIGLKHNYTAMVMLDQAYETAKKCDEVRSQKGLKNWTQNSPKDQECLPPFFGMPISIKDLLHVKGLPTSCGLAAKLKPVQQDSMVVKIVRNRGMIPFIKGNTSQLGKTVECGNSLWGRTFLVGHPDRGTGGSSGGQCGHIYTSCAPLAIGSDMGGSLRVPSEFCQIVTIKSTNFRLQNKGGTDLITSSRIHDSAVAKGVIGPLAKSFRDVNMLFRELVSWKQSQFKYSQINPYIRSQQYQQDLYSQKKPLKIGVLYQGLKVFPANQSAKRAVRIAAQALGKLHQLTKLDDIPSAFQCYKINVAFNVGVGHQKFIEPLQGQPYQPEWYKLLNLLKLPKILRKLAVFILKFKDQRLYDAIKDVDDMSYVDFLQLTARINDARKQLKVLFDQFDLILMPNINAAPFYHSSSRDLLPIGVYQMIWNICQYPSGFIPITRIRQDEQFYKGEQLLDRMLNHNLQNSAGFGVGVQLVGRPFQQQRILRVLGQLSKEINHKV